MECKNKKYNILSFPPRYFDCVDHYKKKAIDAIKEISNNYIEFQKNISRSYQKIYTRFLDKILNSYWKKSTAPEKYSEVYSNLNKKII